MYYDENPKIHLHYPMGGDLCVVEVGVGVTCVTYILERGVVYSSRIRHGNSAMEDMVKHPNAS